MVIINRTLQSCDGRHFSYVVDSLLMNQKHLLATAAMWGSVQRHGRVVREWQLRVMLSGRCLNRAVSVEDLGCGSFKVKCTPSLVYQTEFR